MKNLISLVFVIVVAATGCANRTLPRGKITVKVVDTEENILTNATATVSWRHPKQSTPFWTYEVEHDEGTISKRDGTFTSSRSALNSVSLRATHENYYRSSTAYTFSDDALPNYTPWNPIVTLVLRKIGNPVPMYAKKFHRFDIPNLKAEYDLMKGDFLPPHGKGEVADCIISGDFDVRGESFKPGSIYESFYMIEFLGDFNGVAPISKEKMTFESAFNWPRFSPEHGYDEALIHWFQKNETKASPEGRGVNMREETKIRKPDTQFYFFRIRSEKNPNGTFKSAFYGKMISPSKIYYYYKEKKIWFQDFVYYVNPTRNDRNMEFDTNENLMYKKIKVPGTDRWKIPRQAYKDGETGVSAP